MAGEPTKVIVARDHWKVDELGHVQWQLRKGQMDGLQKLATGGKGRFKNFEKAMTRAFGAELREQQGVSDEPAFWTTLFKTEVSVGEQAPYNRWKDQFESYKGLITATKPMTRYIPDAVFLPKAGNEAWVIETQFELNYEAVGQALSYWYAFNKVKHGVSKEVFSNPSHMEETEIVSKMLQGKEIVPKVVCLAAPEDFRVLCSELEPRIQVFYCEKANATPHSSLGSAA